MREVSPLTRTDRLILAFCVFLALALLVGRPFVLGRDRAAVVQVELAGRTVRRLPLLTAEATVRTVIPLARGRAVLSFEDGGVRILPMPRDLCPRAICSHGGLIRRPGETLVCAPNRLVVRVVGKDRPAVDAIAR